jgi:hypothetical protein
MISHPALPESLIPLCMNILARISDSERDLIRVIVDVVTEIRLGEDDARDRGMSIVSIRLEIGNTRFDTDIAHVIHRWRMMIQSRSRPLFDRILIDEDRVYWQKPMILQRNSKLLLWIYDVYWCAEVSSNV